MVLAIWKNWESMNIGEAILVSIISILIVFAALILLVFVTWTLQKVMEKYDEKTHILPREENEILSEDKNAVIATLVASMDFYREKGKKIRVVSVKRIED